MASTPCAKIVVMTGAQDVERWASEIAADGHLGERFLLADLYRLLHATA
jgi:hypothetical protein